MINITEDLCFCIIECIKLIAKKSFTSTRLINSKIHEHSCKTLYIVRFKCTKRQTEKRGLLDNATKLTIVVMPKCSCLSKMNHFLRKII